MRHLPKLLIPCLLSLPLSALAATNLCQQLHNHDTVWHGSISVSACHFTHATVELIPEANNEFAVYVDTGKDSLFCTDHRNTAYHNVCEGDTLYYNLTSPNTEHGDLTLSQSGDVYALRGTEVGDHTARVDYHYYQ